MACFTKGTPKFVTSAQSWQWTYCQFHLQTNFQQVKYLKESKQAQQGLWPQNFQLLSFPAKGDILAGTAQRGSPFQFLFVFFYFSATFSAVSMLNKNGTENSFPVSALDQNKNVSRYKPSPAFCSCTQHPVQ